MSRSQVVPTSVLTFTSLNCFDAALDIHGVMQFLKLSPLALFSYVHPSWAGDKGLFLSYRQSPLVLTLAINCLGITVSLALSAHKLQGLHNLASASQLRCLCGCRSAHIFQMPAPSHRPQQLPPLVCFPRSSQ